MLEAPPAQVALALPLPTPPPTHPPPPRVRSHQGTAFEFDRNSVHIQHSPVGEVRFEGVWAANGERYRVVMRPPAVSPTSSSSSASPSSSSASHFPSHSPSRSHSSTGGSSSGSSSHGRSTQPLQVGAQHVRQQPGAPTDLEGEAWAVGARMGAPKGGARRLDAA